MTGALIIHSAVLLAVILLLLWFARRDAVRSYQRNVVKPYQKQMDDVAFALCQSLKDTDKEAARLRANLQVANQAVTMRVAVIKFLRARIATLERLERTATTQAVEFEDFFRAALSERNALAAELEKLKKGGTRGTTRR